ncbi:13634_t:CDS:2 [Entrophospora sp. SA101]|nr:13634_t:CDS:2 [Entrophospora sp. SA101]
MKGSGKPSAMMAHLALQCIQVPTLVRQKFLQIIASSNDEVNEQSKTKKNNSSKRVLGLEIASDRRTLSTKLIDKEVARISISIEKELKSEENLSLVVDSWKTHHVNLVCSDIVKKISFGKNVLSQCQKFVSYFQGSYKAGAQFCNEIVEAFIMGGGLKSSVVTRWSSAWDCYPRCMSTNLYNLVNDRNFWANVECLTNVLSPAKKAVKCIESTNSTLADIFLILIQMAATIKQLPISDSTECKGFQRQCIQIYNKRWIQFNVKFYLLCYFLHPKYCSNGMVPVVFHSVIRTALEVWKNLGGGDRSAQVLITQIKNYDSFTFPYHYPYVEESECPKTWWISCKQQHHHLQRLALYTLAIVPHSANCDRLFSVLNNNVNNPNLEIEDSFYLSDFNEPYERENFNRPLEDIEDHVANIIYGITAAKIIYGAKIIYAKIIYGI